MGEFFVILWNIELQGEIKWHILIYIFILYTQMELIRLRNYCIMQKGKRCRPFR